MDGRILTALRVGNFKAFADTQTIPLKPITLIFGPNSAGKSSFIHSLALAHEAQFGREKRNLGRLDIHHTDIGGSSIDLGGFRQYVHRGQANRRVEWGAEIGVPQLSGRLAELLAPVQRVTLQLSIGVALDNEEQPIPGAEPVVMAFELNGDGQELLRMSRRRDNVLRLDRLNQGHPVFRQVLRAIVVASTTTEEVSAEDFAGLDAAVGDLVPQLYSQIERFFPAGIERPRVESEELSAATLFPVSRGNRREDLASAVRFYLPRALDDLLKGLSNVLQGDLRRLSYLGPLRSFPPRHLAFSEHEDTNWYAGGGYAWDVVRRNDEVRETINRWLGDKTKLSTPYELRVRNLLTIDALDKDYTAFVEKVEKRFTEEQYNWDLFGELYGAMADLKRRERVLADMHDLVLVDRRTDTQVTHRDVGIGISQVLPVLVTAYASKNRIIAMEQPEIHLHPGLQAELGDVFVEAAVGARRNTFILETHSEHLILRLLRRIRETASGELPDGATPLKPDDVAVIYVQAEQTGARVIPISVTGEGDFARLWPDGFFAERAKELF
ncbi:MAG: hypothetical protein EPO20_07995 [Betaproteobacteria bacterium]|nr:MAG: hypothetical protein EPO20_07995 [Betaproteobacteria bacterium]